ncbi:MAG: Uma2 family endonuclease [Planctomycetota bacterium]
MSVLLEEPVSTRSEVECDRKSPAAQVVEAGDAFTQPRSPKWSRERFDAAVNAGVFDNWRTEFIDGEIIEMPPQSEDHVWAFLNLDRWCRRVFPEDTFYLRTQNPLRVSDTSEPEPDIAVVRGQIQRGMSHPRSAALAVEISRSTLQLDRGAKLRGYAEARVEEYWILNLVDGVLEVHRKPNPKRRDYDERIVLQPEDTVSPLAAPEATAKVADFLP